MGRSDQARRDQAGIVLPRHCGAERSSEPGIHGRAPVIMDCGLAVARQSGMTGALSSPPDSTHIASMAPKQRDPAKHSKKDPARPTRAKASRPDVPVLDPSLAELLNPAIGQGRAGFGSQTGIPSPEAGEGQNSESGLKPPPDNSWDRRKASRNGRNQATPPRARPASIPNSPTLWAMAATTRPDR
jgi:hypothetical protein